jgi:hypothetical protein
MTDLRQLHFRFRTDAGTADASPTWGAGEDVNYYPGTSNFRLRIGLRNASTVVAATPWELYVSRNGDAYTPVTTTISKGVQSVNAGSSADDTAVLIPRLYPFTTDWVLSGAAIDIDFAGGRIYPGTAFTDYLSITRASTGYAKTATGTLTSFSSNQLRITDLGLLVEDARTNNPQNSQTFEGVGWTSAFGILSVTSSTTTAPDGTVTAEKVIPTTSSAFHFLAQDPVTTSGLPALTTYSVYAKAAGYNFAALITSASGGSIKYRVLVNLTDGTNTPAVDTGTPTNVTTSVEQLANGWFRIVITHDADTNTGIFLGINDTSTWHSFAGDGTSGVYFWGAQIEVGAFASSYIPTSGTSASRAADSITCIGNADTILQGSTATALIDLKTATVSSVRNEGLLWSATGFLGHQQESTYDTRTITFDAGAAHSIGSILGGTVTFTGGAKTGFSWSGAGRSVVGGGGTVATDAFGSMGAANYQLGVNVSGFVNFGYFRRLTLWNSRLADATLQSLTAP